MVEPARDNRLRILATCTAAGLVTLAVYWRTSYPTITWWDSAQYSLAADTLGVVGAPGSLLLTLLGWLVTRVPLGLSSAFTLNLLAGLVAAFTITFAIGTACGLYARATQGDASLIPWSVAAAIAMGTLPLALGPTLWAYAVKFTPYGLTAMFTAMILYALIRWWGSAEKANGNRWLFIVALLVGLDFSVHRTNSLLIPGIILWVLIRRPRVISSIRSLASSAFGLLLGLSTQLLLIPIAVRSPALNMGTPWNLARLWNYISLEQTGGGFLINFLPRRSEFVTHQLRDVIDALGASFFSVHGAFVLLGFFPLVFAVFGIVSLWRKDSRLALALVVMLVTAVLATVAYFNIPESYFRPLHRHYLPCLVIFGVVSAYGAGAVVARMHAIAGRRGLVWTGIMLGFLATIAIDRGAANYATQDHSRSYFAFDFASNLLNQMPRDAILLTNGDNDTFPLWDLQYVEGVRTDVNVINVPLTNAGWYIKEVLCGVHGVSFSRSADEMASLSPVQWVEQEITIAALGGEESAADSIRLNVAPTAGAYLLTQDQVVLDMIQTNHWRRPVMISTTVSPNTLPWLRTNLRLEGLAFRFVPSDDPAPAIDIFRSNLMERSHYRGYADPDITIDETSATMAQNYLAAFISLAHIVREYENNKGCLEVIQTMKALFPEERLRPSDQVLTMTAAACDSTR